MIFSIHPFLITALAAYILPAVNAFPEFLAVRNETPGSMASPASAPATRHLTPSTTYNWKSNEL